MSFAHPIHIHLINYQLIDAAKLRTLTLNDGT